MHAQLQTFTRIEKADSPADLFPVGGEAEAAYKNLAKLCHPDLVPEELKDRATKAFAKLSAMYYCLREVPADSNLAVIGKWSVTSSMARGGFGDLFGVRSDSESGVLKIVRDPGDNELLDRERVALKRLHAGADLTFGRYLPVLLQSFEASGRRANVLRSIEDCFSLSHLRKVFTAGIDFRHVVWMMNRLLEILGFAHRKGVLHGSILPHHLLYRPADHGLVLIDWTASQTFPDDAGHIPYAVKRWKCHYPPEIENRKCYCATDIFMTAKVMQFAAAYTPKRFKAFFEWCTAEAPSARPDDAWVLLDKWKALAEEEYGPPAFVPFNVPLS